MRARMSFEAASVFALALRHAKAEPQLVLGTASSTLYQRWKRRPP